MTEDYRVFWRTIGFAAVGFALMAVALLAITEWLAPWVPVWAGALMGWCGGSVVLAAAIGLAARKRG